MDTTSNSAKRVLLIDSSSILHRSFHGYPEKTGTYLGETVHYAALYGYMEYVNRIFREFEFDELIHVLDPDGGSAYRYAIYPEYKANRAPTPEELKQQKALFPYILDTFQQKWVQMDGIESDDLLATYAQRHADRGDIVMILSPDKDILQLVEDGRITVARYVAQGPNERKTHDFYTEEGVLNKFGVRPDQIADYLAIVGDSADNIPGVFKAGDKTAVKWLTQHGDIETLITHADTITGKIGENLRNASQSLPLYKKLTLLMRDVPAPELSDLIVYTEHNDDTRAIRQLLNIPEHWEYQHYNKPTPTQKPRF